MATEFKLPDLGENIEAGTIVNILVSVGDTIKPDQPVLEIETDKATIEVPSAVGGVVKQIHIQEDQTVKVGELILTVEEGAEGADQAEAQPEPETGISEKVVEVKEEEVKKKEEPKAEEPAAAEAAPPPDQLQPDRAVPSEVELDEARSSVPAAPNVRRLAREIGVDITQIEGSGPQGRISMNDVKRQAQQLLSGLGRAAPAAALPDFSKWGNIRREAMNNVRRKTAEHLSAAWTAIPHVTQFDQADIEELEELRKRFAPKVEEAGGKLTITAILLKVAAAALKAFPKFNASIDMARDEIVYKEYYHIGMAVDTDRGLLVPVIQDVDRKNILELAVEITEIAEKARNGKLSLDEMQGGNFSITNLGSIGGTNFTPIVNSPEAAILGVARGRVEPVYRNGQFEPRTMLPLALSYDHRLIDGADAARFLRWIVETLEQPVLMSFLH